MAALTPLSKVSVENYAKLTAHELMQYNNPLPAHDYSPPLDKPYPCYLFKAQATAEGRAKLRMVLVPDEIEAKRKEKEGWARTPLECDPPIETAPGAPEMPESDGEMEFDVPVAKKAKSVAAGA